MSSLNDFVSKLKLFFKRKERQKMGGKREIEKE